MQSIVFLKYLISVFLTIRYEDLKEEEAIKAKFESEEKASQGSVEKPEDTPLNGTVSKEPASMKDNIQPPHFGKTIISNPFHTQILQQESW